MRCQSDSTFYILTITYIPKVLEKAGRQQANERSQHSSRFKYERHKNRIINMKQEKQYRITVEEIGSDEGKSLQFEYQDREDLLMVIEKLKQGSGLAPETATKLALALRLLGPVMMRDHKHPLFVDFMPHFKHFMHNLKSTVKKTLEK
jgi:hypothetical protein